MSTDAVADGPGSRPDEVELTALPDLSVTPAGGDRVAKVSAAESENGKHTPHPANDGEGGSSPLRSVTVVPAEVTSLRRRTSNDSSHGEDDPDGLSLSPDTLSPLLSTNQYTVRKMAAQALMDVALMMANISQLRTLITAGPDMEYYHALLCLVSFSLLAQLVFAIIIFIIWMRETEDNYREEFMATIRQVAASKNPTEAVEAQKSIKVDRAKREEKFQRHKFTNRLNYCTIVLVFIITVTNMFITGFGIKLGSEAGAEIPALEGRDLNINNVSQQMAG